MSVAAARLFTRLQAAQFYRQLHLDALELVADRPVGTWLDVGCGPGLWARLAAESGHKVLGIDRDIDMIIAARAFAKSDNANPIFELADVESIAAGGRRFDVVSASSLLVVTSDPGATLSNLFDLTTESGAIVVIEAAQDMTRTAAIRHVVVGGLGAGRTMLLPWAWARTGRTIKEELFYNSRWRTTRRSLLGGMVNAWLLDRMS